MFCSYLYNLDFEKQKQCASGDSEQWRSFWLLLKLLPSIFHGYNAPRVTDYVTYLSRRTNKSLRVLLLFFYKSLRVYYSSSEATYETHRKILMKKHR